MEELNLRLVKVGEQLNLSDRTLYHSQTDANDFLIDFRSSILEGIFQSGDIFSCLCDLRKSLEQLGWYILCNGSRENAWASTMSRQMGGGFKIYLLTMGEEMDRKNLVHIFQEASFEELGTVDQQFDFYKRWLKSVGRGF
jgi:hypothetical protein